MIINASARISVSRTNSPLLVYVLVSSDVFYSFLSRLPCSFIVYQRDLVRKQVLQDIRRKWNEPDSNIKNYACAPAKKSPRLYLKVIYIDNAVCITHEHWPAHIAHRNTIKRHDTQNKNFDQYP